MAELQDESHPRHAVRVALVLDLFDTLRAHGYQRPEDAQGLSGSLRAVDALLTAFEQGR